MNSQHNPTSIAPPAGKYTHGIGTPAGARWLHVSGQIGIAADGSVAQSIEAQAENCWNNIRCVLADASMGLEDIVKATVFLTKSEFIAPYRAARDRVLGELRPASTLVIVSALAGPQWLCEIEVIAAKS